MPFNIFARASHFDRSQSAYHYCRVEHLVPLPSTLIIPLSRNWKYVVARPHGLYHTDEIA